MATRGFTPNNKQRVIIDYLRRKDRYLGDLYIGIWEALSSHQNPDRLSQAAHSAREFVMTLPRVLNVSPNSKRNDVYKLVGELLVEGDALGSDEAQLRDSVQRIVDEYKSSQKPHRERLAELIRSLDPARVNQTDVTSQAIGYLFKLYNYFVDVAHHRTRCTPEELAEELFALDDVLGILSQPYFVSEEELERLMSVAHPNADHIQRLNRMLLKSSLVVYLFENLKNPAWFPLLRAEGYFDRGTANIERDGWVSCPGWPQTAFLKRCVGEYSEQVAEVLKGVESDNPRVCQEVVEVALLLPPCVADCVADRVEEWLSSQAHMITLLPERLAEYTVKLTKDGLIESAFKSASSMLHITIDPRVENETDEYRFLDVQPDAKSLVDDWHFEKVVDTIVPALAEVDPVKTIEMLCDKLSIAIRLENHVREISEDDYDHSSIWRPTIENSEQNRGSHDVKDILIDQIRDLCSRYTLEESECANTVLNILGQHTSPVFRRLELHLVCEVIHNRGDLVDQAIANADYHLHNHTHHEFRRLLRSKFGSASQSARESYLKWATDGPDRHAYRRMFEEHFGKSPTLEDVKLYSDRWIRDQLEPIAAHLPGRYRMTYQRLDSALDPTENPDFTSWSKSWHGPTSPRSVEDLLKMSPAEVLKMLHDWRPSDEQFSSSREGLSRALVQAVSASGLEYSEHVGAELVSTLRPTYINAILQGIEQSLGRAPSLDWNSILALCERAACTTESLVDTESSELLESNWRSVHRAIASLIEEGMSENEGSIAFSRREIVWKILSELLERTDPTLASESESDSPSHDPVTLSLNTICGKTAQAICKYIWWVDMNLNSGVDAPHQTHAIANEAKSVLERYLGDRTGSARILRAVLGMQLRLLCFLDSDWIRERTSVVLPEEPEDRKLRDAVLEGQFSFRSDTALVFRTLPEIYEVGLEWVIGDESEDSHLNPKRGFIESVLQLFLWGYIEIDDETSLMSRLFDRLSASQRGFAVEMEGRRSEAVIPTIREYESAIQRLKGFWEWRLAKIESANDKGSYAQELEAFGWWVSQGHFESSWVLANLESVLHLSGGKIDFVHRVLERLENHVAADPETAINCLNLLVRSPDADTSVLYWEAEIQNCLKQVKSSGNSKAWSKATEMIHFLGERGYPHYRGLL